jgi:hypothetical protein
VSNDATGGLGPDAYKATLTNYAFIAHESITAEEALSRLAWANHPEVLSQEDGL